MHLKVFLKLKNPKNSLFWANIYKKKQKIKNKNKIKNPKKPMGWLKKKQVFSNPAWKAWMRCGKYWRASWAPTSRASR